MALRDFKVKGDDADKHAKEFIGDAFPAKVVVYRNKNTGGIALVASIEAGNRKDILKLETITGEIDMVFEWQYMVAKSKTVSEKWLKLILTYSGATKSKFSLLFNLSDELEVLGNAVCQGYLAVGLRGSKTKMPLKVECVNEDLQKILASHKANNNLN